MISTELEAARNACIEYERTHRRTGRPTKAHATLLDRMVVLMKAEGIL